jgi:hypothetical protein
MKHSTRPRGWFEVVGGNQPSSTISAAGQGRLAMDRSAISITAAILVLIPVMGFAQQEASGADESGKPPSGPSPENMATREGLSTSGGGAIGFLKAIPPVPAGTWGIISEGTGGGGIFRDSDSEAEARLGVLSTGVNGYGAVSGGYFQNSVDSGLARLGWGDIGIAAGGDVCGALFAHSSGAPFAWAAYTRDSGTDILGDDNDGDYGVFAGGLYAAAYFEQTMGGSMAYLARSSTGVEGWGSWAGGIFRNTDLSSGVTLAGEYVGIEARGDDKGGYFEDTQSSGAFADVASSTYKIGGNGTVNFIQNHPYDAQSVIVYTAPEGDEVATYTRGTARLVDGEATVPLGETFKWVTNPDVGLTAHVTPRSECLGLYVADVSTETIVVRELQDGTSDCVFDFFVHGLRIGFEETTVLQEKWREAYIPSMSDHRELYQRRPDLRRFNSLERFKTMRHEAGEKKALDLSRAHALRDAIVEFDPAVHEPSTPPGFGARARGNPADRVEGHGELARDEERVRGLRTDQARRRAPSRAELDTVIPADDEGNVCAPSVPPSSREVASLVDVSEAVEPGDVLVIDREAPGMMRRGLAGHDAGVIGVVSENVGVVLGSQSPMLTDEEAGTKTAHRAEVAMAGVVSCKVDAAYGAIWPGDLLVTSPTSGHAMRTDSPLPGTIVGKALEALEEGTGLIRVLVMLR